MMQKNYTVTVVLWVFSRNLHSFSSLFHCCPFSRQFSSLLTIIIILLSFYFFSIFLQSFFNHCFPQINTYLKERVLLATICLIFSRTKKNLPHNLLFYCWEENREKYALFFFLLTVFVFSQRFYLCFCRKLYALRFALSLCLSLTNTHTHTPIISFSVFRRLRNECLTRDVFSLSIQ